MRFVNAPVERESVVREGSDRTRLKALLVAMASVTLALASIFGRHGVLDVARYRAERDRMRAEIQSMEVEQKRLEAELAAIEKDPAALERNAREEQGLGAPGEALILLEPAPPPQR